MARMLSMCLLVICVFAHAPDLHSAGPVITKLDPAEAGVGETVKIQGERLKKTRSVNFLVDNTVKSAEFQADSDSELSVVVPEFLSDKSKALLFVHTQEGLAVTCPVDALVAGPDPLRQAPTILEEMPLILRVIRGGKTVSGHPPVIIEEGGIVDEPAEAPVVLVKKGGTLRRIDTDCSTTIIHEHNAKIESRRLRKNSRVSVHDVSHINLAEGIGPFVIRTTPTDAGRAPAKKAPTIDSVNPHKAAVGQIITVEGSGLTGTKAVFLVSTREYLSPFQVVSDTQLKVEIPNDLHVGSFGLIVANDRGVTTTLSEEDSKVAKASAKGSPKKHVTKDSEADTKPLPIRWEVILRMTLQVTSENLTLSKLPAALEITPNQSWKLK